MKKYQKYVLISLFSIFLIIGLLTYKDYGIGIEENFQRASGFYWLKFLINFTELENLKSLIDYKINEVYNFNLNLPKVEKNLGYGIIFDLPTSLLEILINFDDNKNNIYLKHFIGFLCFFISAILFSLILKKQFSNLYVTIFGTLIYFFSPRIYGTSFFDGKDLFFLSMFTITLFFYLNFENSKKIISLIIFSLFAAFATSSRIVGIMIPISFLIIYIFQMLSRGKIKNEIKLILIFLFSYILFLFIHWPYLWNLDFGMFTGDMNLTVFFNGEYYKQKYLPLNYIPVWIFITTPLFIILLFISGLFLKTRRFFLRLINIKKDDTEKNQSDFWKGRNEKIDFFIFLCFLQTVFLYLAFDLQIYSAWRHFFFVHFFISYFSAYAIYLFFLKIRKNKTLLNIILMLLLFFNFEMFYKIYKYHPFQNIYFNNLQSSEKKLNFERDIQSLSRFEALKNILDNDSSNKIKISTASFTPLADVLYMFSKEDIERIKFIGTNSKDKADYIYTNYIYEVDIRYNKKYKIPENFYLFKSVIKDGTLIYSIYKREQ